MMTTIKSAKAALRKSMRQRLANLTSESLTAQCASHSTDWIVYIEALGISVASAVTRHITSHPAFQKSKCVACYLSMPTGEIQTDDIVDAVLGQGECQVA
jgi:5-formyltetrahydrofolate cyclo-ligase